MHTANALYMYVAQFIAVILYSCVKNYYFFLQEVISRQKTVTDESSIKISSSIEPSRILLMKNVIICC